MYTSLVSIEPETRIGDTYDATKQPLCSDRDWRFYAIPAVKSQPWWKTWLPPAGTNLVRHIRNLILAVNRLPGHIQRRGLAMLHFLLIRPRILRFAERALQDLHDAMGIRVVVDRAAFAGRPDQDELVALASLH